MKSPADFLSHSNPFSTRFVRPGAIDFIFPAEIDCDQLIMRLAANGWLGALVGPHGCGKSTLLSTLLAALQERGFASYLVSLHDGQRWLPRGWSGNLPHKQPGKSLLAIDGYEQLNRWSRWSLCRRCRRNGWGLLVTTHEPVSIPTLIQLRPSLETLQAIVNRLLPPGVRTLTPEDVIQAFEAARGNLREALFDLYDRHEGISVARRPAE